MERKLIDDCFYVEEKKWGTWDSYDKDGKCLITALRESECINATRQYLKWKQEGFPETKTHEGEVSGKI